MKKAIPYLVTSMLLSAPALAQQPEAAGKDVKEPKVPVEAQARIAEHREMAEGKRQMAAEKRAKQGEIKAKKEEKALMAEEKHLDAKKEGAKAEKENKGMTKQAEKKAEQERKELGTGSEQGQQAREENSKKWWHFWK